MRLGPKSLVGLGKPAALRSASASTGVTALIFLLIAFATGAL